VGFSLLPRLKRGSAHSSALLALLCSLAVSACTGQAQQASPQAPAGGRSGGRGGDGAPVPVVTAAAVERSVPVTVTAVGTAEAISTNQVRSQVNGRVAQIHFAEGQDVEAGQPLFTIDPQPFQVALDQATAVLARDTAQATNAQAQVERFENLYKRGLIPRDQYETQMATAAALKATTAADEASVSAAKLNLEYTKIAAPASGRTGALLVHPGDLVQANVATPLVVINQVAPIYVSFAIPGKVLDEIRRAQRNAPLRVTASLSGEDDATEDGRLTFIDNAVDPQTATIKMKATFANPSHRLWPGQYADVTLELRSDLRAVVIPSVAIQSGQQGPYVFVVADGKAVIRPVTVARVQGALSVIQSGVTPGDVVVTDGQLRLTPNARVTQRGGGPGGGAGERSAAGRGESAGAGGAASAGRGATGETR
jgi:multidrug efflux system membrane fusion protein